MNLQDLHKPFPPDAIHWRVGSMTKDKKRGLALAYLDARNVMERLDEVCGQDGWQDSYVETPTGRVVCTISIRMNMDEWVSKSDGAGNTDIEGDKGGISDAFKRAAVKWGIGRYLYALDSPWVALDEWKKILPSEQPKLDKALSGEGAPIPNNAPTKLGPTQKQVEDCGSVKAAIMACKSVETLKELAASPLFGASVEALHPELANEMRREWSDRKAFLADKEERARVAKSNDELTGPPPAGNGLPQSENMATG